jgi:hypothetical protein
MTSHIFVALGMWQEVVDANIAAIAVVNADRKKAGKVPAGCGHYPTWLNYGNLQLAQAEKARDAVAQCRARIDAEADMERAGQSLDPDNSLVGSYADMRLRYLIDTGGWPDEMASWTLPANAGAGARLDFHFARVLNAVMRGDHSQAEAGLKDMEIAAKSVVDIQSKSGDPDPTYRVRPEIFLLEARGLISELNKSYAEAEKFLSKAVQLEDSLPIAFGPPAINKPTHELFGEFLSRRGRKDEAHAEFKKAVARTPGRRSAEKGLRETGTN